MDLSPNAVLQHVLMLLHRLGGKQVSDGAEKLIAADHGVTGWDAIELLEELEATYQVDLRPFMDARSTKRKGWFRTYTVTADATARELANNIAALIADR